MLERYACKKFFVISVDCYMIDGQVLHLNSAPNHILIYSLNFKKDVSLISIGNWFHIFASRTIRLFLSHLVLLRGLILYQMVLFSLHRKWNFLLRIFSVYTDLVIFTEENLNGKHFLCSVSFKSIFHNFGLILLIVLKISIVRVFKRLIYIVDLPFFSNNAS